MGKLIRHALDLLASLAVVVFVLFILLVAAGIAPVLAVAFVLGRLSKR